MKLNRMGILLLISAAVVWGLWSRWYQTRNWNLVNVPISLQKGNQIETNEFVPNVATTYTIQIEAANKIAPETLGCSLGNGPSWRNNSCTTPVLLNVSWLLSNAGTLVAQGSTAETLGAGASSATSTYRTLGYFNAKKEQRYRLRLQVLGDSGSLDAASPRLIINAGGAYLESKMLIDALLEIICIASGSIGALLVLLHYWKRAPESRGSVAIS